MRGQIMSSEGKRIKSEENGNAGRFLAVVSRTQRAQTGFLLTERVESETIDCASREEAQSYTPIEDEDSSVSIYDLESLSGNGVPQYFNDLFERPAPAPEQYIQGRLDRINARVRQLTGYDLETVILVHPNGAIEPSNGHRLYVGASKTLMWEYLSSSVDLNDEACTLAIVWKIGFLALKASDYQNKSLLSMKFAEKYTMLALNLDVGPQYTYAMNSKASASQGGQKTGRKSAEKKTRCIARIYEILRIPGVNNIDAKQRLKNVKAQMKLISESESPWGKRFPADRTISGWIESAI